jgi:hypothetical protein
LEPVLPVHVEKVDGRASFGGKPEDSNIEESEVVPPEMLAWVVEGRHSTGVRIDGGDVRALLQVAADAAQAKVLRLV